MSRVRNADEFLLQFRGIRKAYEDLFAPRVAQIRKNYAIGFIEIEETSP